MTLKLIANTNATIQHKWLNDGLPGGQFQSGIFSFDSSQGDVKNKIESNSILSGVGIKFNFSGGTVYTQFGSLWVPDPNYSAGTATTSAIPAQALPEIPVFIIPTAIYTKGENGAVIRQGDTGTMNVYAQLSTNPFNFVLVPGIGVNVVISNSGQLLNKVKGE